MCMATLSSTHTTLPPSNPERMGDLSLFLDQLTEPAVLLGPNGQAIPLPSEAFDLLQRVAKAMSCGKAITIAPVDQRLTTQEAANFLGISRPTLIKLLDEGRLAYEYTPGGRHRRIFLQDVVAYQEEARRRCQVALDELTASAYASGHYETRDEGYLMATKQARKDIARERPHGTV